MKIRLELERQGYEIVYLDEFRYSSTSNKHYGWTSKGTNGYLFYSADNFDASFMIAFTKVSIIGVMSTTESNNSIKFKYFVQQILSQIGPKHAIIMDNVPIHKQMKFNNSEMTETLL